MFNTSIQLGASIGVAVIGVIFFGLLGTQSGPAATAVAPQLRTALTAAGLPRGATAPVVTAFGRCLHDRLVAADPTATPPSCRAGRGHGALPGPARHAIAGIGRKATGIDFATALQRTLFFQVGVFAASFLMMLALPSRRRARPSAAPAADRLVTAPVLVRATDQR
ncbi:MAG TPA: hypothetical protein VF162_03870 [Streptosporangiaceae bacterium]